MRCDACVDKIAVAEQLESAVAGIDSMKLQTMSLNFKVGVTLVVAVLCVSACRSAPKQRLNAGDQAFLTELRPIDPAQRFDTPPKIIRSVAIAYPGVRLQEREEGAATVEFTITPRGKIEEMDITESTSPAFSGYLLMRLQQWRFVPAQLEGEAVPVRYRQRFTFDLDAGNETRQNRDKRRLERENSGPQVVDPS